MALSAFDDKSTPPGDCELAETLGPGYDPWNELKRRIAERFAPLSVEWGYSGRSTGWGLRLKQEKRAVLYLIPCNGYFLASFALGEKAVRAAHESDLPAPVLEVIDRARKYAEGRGVRLEVREPGDVDAIENLAIIKMKN